jgi:hypothetical protein
LRRAQLALGVVLLVRVHRPQPRTVDGHHAAVHQAKSAADGDKTLARYLDRAGLVMAEVGNGLEIGDQLAGQLHQLDIAARLALKLPACG